MWSNGLIPPTDQERLRRRLDGVSWAIAMYLDGQPESAVALLREAEEHDRAAP